MAIQLRQIMVSEWIENSSRYEGFLPDVCIQQEAPKFLIPGNFYGPLADTMLTALCNALQTPIIVFSSIECHPFFLYNSSKSKDISTCYCGLYSIWPRAL